MNIKIDLLPNLFLKEDGTYDKEKAINLCGKIAGVCYDKEGFENLKNEDAEKTNKRIDRTLNSGHHSVYDHVIINLNIHNIPKILAMVINNEKMYTTSEKSGRYTNILGSSTSTISKKEEKLYNKWLSLFKTVIKKEYGEEYNDSKIEKLAQENARYLITVFMPTEMIYSASLRQLNYLASFMKRYIKLHDKNNKFESKLCKYMNEFISELDRNNILEEGLLKNEKERRLSLFGNDLNSLKEIFTHIYSTTYKESFVSFAQAQRHRTLSYKIEMLDTPEYFIPPILLGDESLSAEWLNDMRSVENVFPQGMLILVNEQGTFENFILKCKERFCSAAQLEIMLNTKEIFNRYKLSLYEQKDSLYENILKYSKGARCTFPDYTCLTPCTNKERKRLEGKI